MDASSGNVYVLHRLNWRRTHSEGVVRMPGHIRIASYPDHESALREWRRLENETRKLVNPFTLGSALVSLTRFPAEIFADWLRDVDLSPPTPSEKDPYPWV